MTLSRQRPLLVRACIPHFYSGTGDPNGYGSRRQGARVARSIALAQCLSSLIRLKHSTQDAILNIGNRTIDYLSNEIHARSNEAIRIEILVCTDGRHQLDEILNHYDQYIERRIIDVDDPRLLPLAARDELISHSKIEADLYTYLEDDIIIHDSSYFHKQDWFLRKTNDQLSLMPHRYESINRQGIRSLLVDGPLDAGFISKFASPQENVASGLFRGIEQVSFDIANNPHSGTFTLSKKQALQLQKESLPTSGFVGPLETAATLTVLKFFPVLKPSKEYRSFLMVEHGHPSFKHYTKTLPHRQQQEGEAIVVTA